MIDEPCWREILDELREIRIRLAVITEQIKDVADHEERLRALERRVWALPSLATAIAILSAAKDWIK